MAFEQRDNYGALFKNKKKVEGDNKPNYTGTAMVNGQMVDIAAWVKDAKSGMKFMSLSFKPPQQRQEQGMGEYQGESETRSQPRQVNQPSIQRPTARPAPTPEPFDESIPF